MCFCAFQEICSHLCSTPLVHAASKADCKAVTALINYLAKGFASDGRPESAVQPLDAGELTELTRKALIACPTLGARGQWTTYWDDSKKASEEEWECVCVHVLLVLPAHFCH